MNDMQRTLTYVAVACIAAVVAWEPWQVRPVDEQEVQDVKLFPKFTDPLAAKSMEITKYDEKTSMPEPPFKVAQINGVWSIPSHSNYPADAHDHMAKAATSVMDLETLGQVSDKSGDQELYGVVDPDPKTLHAGAVGVGTRVTLRDVKDDVLADLIIGKEVKDQPELRYVRKPDNDRIYKVALKTDALSTKFEDWIEKDLLKLKAFDIREVELNDSTSDAAQKQRGVIEISRTLRSKTKLDYSDDKAKWSPVDLIEYDKEGKPTSKPLAENEELDSVKLNDLKTALSDLKIVDVQPKPKGLSADLRTTKAAFVNDDESLLSLMQRGFYPVSVGDDKVELYSGEGEVVCGLKDGVEYVLRFGNPTGTLSKDDEKPDDKDGKKEAGGENRFILVMAQLNENLIPKPELTPLPGEKAAEEKAAEKKDDATKKDDAAGEAAKAAEDDDKPGDLADEKPAPKPAKKPEKPADPKAKKTPAKGASGPAKPGAAVKTAQLELAAAPKGKDGKAKPAAADETPETKPAAGEKPADATAADEAAEPAKKEKVDGKAARAKSADDEAAEEERARKADEKRHTIEKENKRKQDDYTDKVKKAKERVDELNNRFADWYYVIPDSVYRKIHLSRADIVKAKEKPAAEGHAHDDHDGHDHDHDDHEPPIRLPAPSE